MLERERLYTLPFPQRARRSRRRPPPAKPPSALRSAPPRKPDW